MRAKEAAQLWMDFVTHHRTILIYPKGAKEVHFSYNTEFFPDQNWKLVDYANPPRGWASYLYFVGQSKGMYDLAYQIFGYNFDKAVFKLLRENEKTLTTHDEAVLANGGQID